MERSTVSRVSSGTDERRHPRHSIHLPVVLGCLRRGSRQHLRTRDISYGGVFIKSAGPLPTGSPVEVLATAPDGRTIKLRGEVVHTVSAEQAKVYGLSAGMGIRFDPPDPALERQLHLLVEGARESAAGTGAPPVRVVDVQGRQQSPLARDAMRRALKQAAYKHYADALLLIEELLRQEPENGFARCWLEIVRARGLEAAGDAASALRHYEAVLKLDPEHREARKEARRLTGGFWRRLFGRSRVRR